MTPFQLRAMGLLLRQGRRLHGASMGLAALTAVWLVMLAIGPSPHSAAVPALLLASLLAAGVQLYAAIRTGFDADLFVALSEHEAGGGAIDALDAALDALGARPADAAPRGWADRRKGARGWLHRQGAALATQAALFVSAWVLAV